MAARHASSPSASMTSRSRGSGPGPGAEHGAEQRAATASSWPPSQQPAGRGRVVAAAWPTLPAGRVEGVGPAERAGAPARRCPPTCELPVGRRRRRQVHRRGPVATIPTNDCVARVVRAARWVPPSARAPCGRRCPGPPGGNGVPAGSCARVGPQAALRNTATPSITSTSARSSWSSSIDSSVGRLAGGSGVERAGARWPAAPRCSARPSARAARRAGWCRPRPAICSVWASCDGGARVGPGEQVGHVARVPSSDVV